jgi:HTH-type transcriptional regulator/antitoxin HigA
LAAEICDKLLDRFDSLSPLERDYLEVLSDLIEHFESHWQEEKAISPRELLVFLMEQNGLSQTDMIPELGTSSRVSEFLSGKRELSLTQITSLAKRFSLSPTAFIVN